MKSHSVCLGGAAGRRGGTHAYTQRALHRALPAAAAAGRRDGTHDYRQCAFRNRAVPAAAAAGRRGGTYARGHAGEAVRNDNGTDREMEPPLIWQRGCSAPRRFFASWSRRSYARVPKVTTTSTNDRPRGPLS